MPPRRPRCSRTRHPRRPAVSAAPPPVTDGRADLRSEGRRSPLPGPVAAAVPLRGLTGGDANGALTTSLPSRTIPTKGQRGSVRVPFLREPADAARSELARNRPHPHPAAERRGGTPRLAKRRRGTNGPPRPSAPSADAAVAPQPPDAAAAQPAGGRDARGESRAAGCSSPRRTRPRSPPPAAAMAVRRPCAAWGEPPCRPPERNRPPPDPNRSPTPRAMRPSRPGPCPSPASSSPAGRAGAWGGTRRCCRRPEGPSCSTWPAPSPPRAPRCWWSTGPRGATVTWACPWCSTVSPAADPWRGSMRGWRPCAMPTAWWSRATCPV